MIDQLPNKEVLLSWYKTTINTLPKVYKVNAHIHTPYSFSAFESIDQAFELASSESISVLGINDFIVTDGYDAFYEHAMRFKIYPLFNIEFMGLLPEEQQQGIRINDPNNPGRIYFSGKALKYPAHPPKKLETILNKVRDESNRQTSVMIFKVDQLLKELKAPFRLNFLEVKKTFARELVRERHIAKALRVKAFRFFDSDEERKAFFEMLFQGKAVKSSMDNYADLENEIRGNMLKSGGAAYVPEDPNAFLVLDEIVSVILQLGGIPTYPVLLDDAKGNFTEYEADYEKLHKELSKRNIASIELIPVRNDFNKLKEFVRFFNERGYVITFGTEHNTPELAPLTVNCRHEKALDEELMQISFEGACILAAHQYLKSRNEEGYVDAQGKAQSDKYQEFVELGSAVIARFVQ